MKNRHPKNEAGQGLELVAQCLELVGLLLSQQMTKEIKSRPCRVLVCQSNKSPY